MTVRFAYDAAQDPPAPVLPVRVGTPAGGWSAALPFLVDTGADITVIPARLARDLQLPPVGELGIVGATGKRVRAPIYGAELQIGAFTFSAQIAALGRETLIGRDVLNRWTLVLRGRRQILEIEAEADAAG